jgi:hypothetical protein
MKPAPKGQAPPPPPQQEGLPNPDSVVEVKEFVSPKGRKYTILKTTEFNVTRKRRKPRS